MNILFLYNNNINPTKGGVQRVTKVLADYFELKGNNVFFLSLSKHNDDEYIDKRQYYVPENKKFNTKNNIEYLKVFIETHRIDVVINQGGLGKDCSRLANYSKDFGAIEISVLHSSLSASINNFSITKKEKFKKIHLDLFLPLSDIKWIKNLILWLYKWKYKKHFIKLCYHSDRVVLLSNNFKEELSYFLGDNNNTDKIIAIPNPCSFTLDTNYTIPKKEKILLFVGRIDFMGKRVDLLIGIWNRIYSDFPEWKMVIVGDGPDLAKAKEIANNLGTQRIYFEGRQNPEPFYEKASIFCMTSSFEGFGLVLVEAQTYGVVPVAFNSFASVTDIIQNGETGFLVDPFDEKKYVEVLSDLMSNNDKLCSISRNCVDSAMKFTIEKIGNQWLELFISTRSEYNENK